MGLLALVRSKRAMAAAVAAMRAGRLREAAAGFERYLLLNAGDWEAWRYLGDCRYDLGEMEAAERALRRSLELNGDCAKPRGTLALLLAERDRAWDSCFPLLEQCLVETTQAGIPECTELSLAWCHYLQGDAAQADAHFDRACACVVAEETEQDAVLAGVAYRTGVLCHALKQDNRRAVEHLREAIRLSPESIYARRAQELIGRLPASER